MTQQVVVQSDDGQAGHNGIKPKYRAREVVELDDDSRLCRQFKQAVSRDDGRSLPVRVLQGPISSSLLPASFVLLTSGILDAHEFNELLD